MCQNYTDELLHAYWGNDTLYHVHEPIVDDNRCHHDWDDEPEPACRKCAESGDPSVFVVFQENKPMRRHMTHQPKEYIKRKIELLSGIERGTLWRLRDDPGFADEVRACDTWPKVYTVCSVRGVGEWFLGMPAWLGHPVGVGRHKDVIYEIIYARGFKLQFMYAAHKLSQLWGRADPWIPLKITHATLAKAEVVWRAVCVEWGIPYKKTCMDDLKTPWADSILDVQGVDA